MTALLDIDALRGGYGRVEVLRGVDLSVDRGEIVALLGSNGAGKSTLNNTVCGIVPAWGGAVRFQGRDLTNAHYRDVVLAGLIQVPEGRKIFPNLTVRENLELGSFTRARARRAQNLERVFSRADEPDVEGRTGDTTRLEAALASGAHWISTDYPGPGGASEQYGTDYVAQLPEFRAARCNPLTAPDDCDDDAVEPQR